MSWFDDIDQAIDDGLKFENIDQDNVINTIKLNDDFFVVFNYPGDDLDISVSNVAQKNNKFAWLKIDKTYTEIKTPLVAWPIETYSKEAYTICAGNDYNLIKDANERCKIKSEVYEHEGIYYFIKYGLYNN